MTYVAGDPRDQLAYLGREVVRAGLVVGSGGNLSARTPGGESCWVTASGTWLDRLDRSSFVPVRIADGACGETGGAIGETGGVDTGAEGGVPCGPPPSGPAPSGPTPSSEVALHLATYRARPDVHAIVHLHPQSALLLDALDVDIRLVTTDHIFYLRRVARVPFRPPGTAELAELAAAAAADGTNCLILAQHGCSVLGESVEMAHRRAANLEEAARLTYQALAIGRLDALPDAPPEFLDRLSGIGGATV